MSLEEAGVAEAERVAELAKAQAEADEAAAAAAAAAAEAEAAVAAAIGAVAGGAECLRCDELPEALRPAVPVAYTAAIETRLSGTFTTLDLGLRMDQSDRSIPSSF